MESGFGLLSKALGPVVTGGDFKVEVPDFPAVVLVLNAEIGNWDLVIHDLQVELVRDEDAFVGRVFVRPHPGESLVEIFLEFEVEDDAPNLSSRAFDFCCDLLIQPVEIGVVAGLLGLHKTVVRRLPIGDKLGTLKESVAVLRKSKYLR